MRNIFRRACLCVLFCAAVTAVEAAQVEMGGGLVVCIGADSLESVSKDWKKSGCVFQCLETSAEKVSKLRKKVQDAGCYGKVSVAQFNGKNLPYINNLVNQVVVSDDFRGISDEVMRVLAPGGVAIVKGKKTIKPWAPELDVWPQYLHDADNNAVSQDKLVGPPRRMQWVGNPAWGRSHMGMSPLNSIVTANGRLFTIEDHASVEFPLLPGKYALTARDAFNGVPLWTYFFPEWEPITRATKGTMVQQQRRIAAIGDKVFCTPGIEAPVTLFDGATGEILKVYKDTQHTQELVYHDGILYCVIGDRVNAAWYKDFFGKVGFNDAYAKETQDKTDAQCEIHAIDAESGKLLWKIPAKDMSSYVACSLAIKNNHVAYQTSRDTVCLDRKTGKEIWRTRYPIKNADGMSPPTLVLTDQAVYVAASEDLKAFTLKDGKLLWSGKAPYNYRKGPDLFVTEEAVWTGNLTAHDPLTGQKIRKIKQSMHKPMGHDRCYRNFITEKYYINSKTGGADFLDLKTGKEYPNPWVRGACGMGVIPANGLVYSSPYSCTCVIGSMLKHFNALLADDGVDVERKVRLEKGSSYGAIANRKSQTDNSSWSTYRYDAGRNGVSPAKVPSKLTPLWKAKVTTRPSAPTIAEGKVFVADIDAHTVCAFDEADGKLCWKFTAGGRVDSPPTIYKGLCLFGSHDGWVYCLKASDGSLVWKFKDLPDRLIGAFGQVESAWPVFGSVLVENDIVYFTAGRSSFLDGGIFLYGLELATGKIVYQKDMPAVYGSQGFPRLRSGKNIRGFKGDVLQGDGKYIHCRHETFKKDLTSVSTENVKTPHIIPSAGFLDDIPQHRTYWTIGTDVTYAYASPYQARWEKSTGPQGDILVRDGKDFYEVRGFVPGRHSLFDPRKGFTLWAGTMADKATKNVFVSEDEKGREKDKKKKRSRSAAAVTKTPFSKRWAVSIPLSGKAIVKASDVIFVAGEPVMFPDDKSAKAYAESAAGERGGVLWAASAADGKKLASYKLDAAPAWDGMAVANGKLYIALKDGTIECWK